MSNQTTMGTSYSTSSSTSDWVETHSSNENTNTNSSDEVEQTPLIKSKLSVDTTKNEASSIQIKEIEPSLITVIEPKSSHIYILVKDGYKNICFSPNKHDLFRMIKTYKADIILKYNAMGSHNIFSDVCVDIYSIYERCSNFLFSYDSLITSFHIIKVPHFRTELLKDRSLY